MSIPIKITINVTRILKEYLFDGKNGKYLSLVVWKNRVPDQYGNTHRVDQDLPKEARDAGVKPPVLGNAKFPDSAPAKPMPAAQSNQRPKPARDPDLDVKTEDDIPF